MLGLQVAAPAHLVFKLVVILLQDPDRLCVGDMSELGVYHTVQTLDQPLVHKGIEELNLLRRIFHDIADDVFQHILRKDHVILQICKSNLRLDHPELRRMTGGVFCTESRSEGVDIAERLRIHLSVELSAHRQIRLFSEKVFCIVNLTVCRSRRILKIQRCHLEHLSGALAVASRNERRVYIDKIALLEEFMDSVRCQRTHTKGRLKHIGARTQMRDRAQKLYAVALFLKRIVGRGTTLHRHLIRLDLKRLLCLRRRDQRALYNDCRADIQPADFRKVVHLIVEYDLQRLKKGAVMKHKEPKGLGIAHAAHPSAHGDLPVQICLSVSVYLSYCY